MPTLRYMNGPHAESTLALKGGEVIGRDATSAIQVLGTGVSRRHCQFVRADPYFLLVDLSSQNGTYLNGTRVTKALLRDQDVVTVGYLSLRYEDARVEIRPQVLRDDGAILERAPLRLDSSELGAGARRARDGYPTPTIQPQVGDEAPKPTEEPIPAAPQVDDLFQDSGGPPQRPESLLDRLGVDLTQLAREGSLDPLIGRRNELRRLGQVLLQKRKPNAVLVGEPGVGKTCLVEGLAARIASGDAPRRLANTRVVQLSLGDLVAGTKYRGEFEERLQQVLREAAAEEDLVLFLDELHLVVGLGSTENSSADAANLLKPMLARADLRVIGATTPEEYEQHVARDRAFARRFEVVWIEEPSRAETLEILARLRPSYEDHHGLKIQDDALEAAVELSLRYLPERRLPDKALDLLDQACARALMGSFRAPRDSDTLGLPLERCHVADVIGERCRVPRASLMVKESERLEALGEGLRERVIGQDHAIEALTSVLRAARAGLRDATRPLASLLFVGPSGVGKTELCKALAQQLFLDEERLIRLDLSEYSERHSVSRLLGAPPGYVGHREEGQLTGPIRRSPFAVVLFDEVEKAHPQVLDVLLQLLDEGRVRDAQGRPASFRETIVVLSSNLGFGIGAADRGGLGFGGEDEERSPGRTALEAELRPELLNRIDRVVEFRALSIEALAEIAELRVAELSRRLRLRGVGLEVSREALEALAARGNDPRYGARELTRALEQELTDPLARALTQGALRQGDRARLERQEEAFVLTFAEGIEDGPPA